MGATVALDQSYGYGIVLGLGFAFAFGRPIATYSHVLANTPQP